MYMETEIMYPPDVTPTLRDVCGSEWRKLVEHVSSLDEAHPESLAFSLMMIRLDGCMECETDSFRAMRGCAACAMQTVRRFRSHERELLKMYKAALKDVQGFLARCPPTSFASQSIPLTPVNKSPRRVNQPALTR